MVRRKLLVPLAWGWLPFLSLALAISLVGCQGQVAMEEALAKAAESVAETAAAVSAESRSVQVGKAFPDFELKDQDGKSFSLKKTLKKGPVVLVIYRSAAW